MDNPKPGSDKTKVHVTPFGPRGPSLQVYITDEVRVAPYLLSENEKPSTTIEKEAHGQ